MLSIHLFTHIRMNKCKSAKYTVRLIKFVMSKCPVGIDFSLRAEIYTKSTFV